MRKRLIFVLLILLLPALLTACIGQTGYEAYPGYDEIYQSYEPQPYEPYESEYIPDTQEPLYLREDMPHGYLAVRYIELINDTFYDRLPFTYREKDTAEWLVEELLAMGYTRDNIEVQEFYRYDLAVQSRLWMDIHSTFAWWGAEDVLLRYYSQNVILTLAGESEQKIIVGAHYDSLPYPGASDNASGVALLLESALRMREVDNYHTIVYVFFGAEKIGLVGAHIYYDSLTEAERDNIVMMINADTLIEGAFFLYGAGYAPEPEPGNFFVDIEPGSNAVSQQVSAIAQEIREIHGVELASIPGSIQLGSDQLVFLWEGHTVVQLYGADLQPLENGLFGGQWRIYGDYVISNRVLHSPQDDFHYINEAWPGKIDAAMWTFSLFLEGMLGARF